MADTGKTIMSWSQCKIEIGATGANDAMATSLEDIGLVLEDSTSLETDLGTPLEIYSSGHKLVAQEYPQETLTLVTTVIEPDALLTKLGIASAVSGAEGEEEIKTHVVNDFFSVKVTPKHAGARGIKAPKCKISYEPIYGETTGNQGILRFAIAKTTEATDNYWYRRFKTTTELA